MSFSLMMVRESELEAYGCKEPSPSQPEWDDIEDDSFDDENLLIVSMADTSFSLVLARGCDPDNPCNKCGKTNCKFNEVVVLPARAEVTSGKKLVLDSLPFLSVHFLNVCNCLRNTKILYLLNFLNALIDVKKKKKKKAVQ